MLGVENVVNSIAVPEPFALEIAGDADGVVLMVRCRDKQVVKQQLGAHYPQAMIEEVALDDDPMRLKEGEQAWSTTLRLQGPEYLPLRTFRDDDLLDQGSDPLIALIGSMSDLEEGERLVARLSLSSLGPDWPQPYLEKAQQRPAYERPLSPDAEKAQVQHNQVMAMGFLLVAALPAVQGYLWVRDGEAWKTVLLGAGVVLALALAGWVAHRFRRARRSSRMHDPTLIQEKTSRIAFEAGLEVTAILSPSGHERRAEQLLSNVAAAYRHYDNVAGARYKVGKVHPAAPTTELEPPRPGLLQGRNVLGVREVAALWHPPGAGDEMPMVRRSGAKVLLLSTRGVRDGAHVGRATAGKREKIHIPDDTLRRHHFYVARTRMGKSTLMGHLIVHKMNEKAAGRDDDAIYHERAYPRGPSQLHGGAGLAADHPVRETPRSPCRTGRFTGRLKEDSMKKKHLRPLTPAALYARVSSDRQDVDLSVSAQLRALKEYARANGYSVAREYVDEAESGRVADRPQFREMIEEGSKTLHYVLRNEAYTGTAVWGKTSKGQEAQDPVRVEEAWPALVSRELFDDVQQAMSDRAPKVQRPGRVGSKFLLSGLLKCGVCGRPYSAQGAKSGQFAYYICGTLFREGAGTCSARYLNAPKLETFVVEKIRERILNEETIVALVTLVAEEIDAMAGELSGSLEVVEAELGDVRKRLEKLYEAIETSELTLEVLSPRIMSLRHREEQLAAAREDAETQLEQRRVELPDTEEIARYVADFRDFLKDGTIPERKALIRNFVEGIEVMGDEATLTYTVPMPSDGAMSESASVLDFVKSSPPAETRTTRVEG